MEKLNSLEVSLTIGYRLDCKYCPQRLLLSRYFENDPTRNAQLKFDSFVLHIPDQAFHAQTGQVFGEVLR